MSDLSDQQSDGDAEKNFSGANTVARQRRYVRLAAIVVLVIVALLKPRVDEWLGDDEQPQGNETAVVENDSTNDTGSESVESELDETAPADVQDDESVSDSTSESSSSDPESNSEDREPGELTEIRPRVFQSTAGLLYLPGSEEGHRLQHVMEHAEDEPERPIHGVFEGDQAAILRNIDIAYQRVLDKKSGVHAEESRDRIAYTIDLRNRIGYVGGQVGKRNDYPECRYLKLVLEDGNEVITAFPTNRSR